jgi:hypothetical protein
VLVAHKQPAVFRKIDAALLVAIANFFIVAIESTPAKNYVLIIGILLTVLRRTLKSINLCEIPEFVNLAIALESLEKQSDIFLERLLD